MVKYLERFKAKLNDSELWIGGGNARLYRFHKLK